MSSDGIIPLSIESIDPESYELLPEPSVAVPFGGHTYSVVEWVPGMPVPFVNCPAIATDTETKELVSGERILPAVAQIAAHGHDTVMFVKPHYFQACLEALDKANPHTQWVFFNGPFDAKVLGWPCDVLWRAFHEGRFVDLEVRGVLVKLAEGTYTDKLNLDMFSREFVGVELDKDAAVRLSFMPGITLTERQVRYAAQDSLATIIGWSKMQSPMPTEDINLKGYFALTAISDFGILLDEGRRDYLNKAMLDVQLGQRSLLKLFGIAPSMPEVNEGKAAPGTKKQRQRLLEALEKQYDVKLKRSRKSGDIVTEKKDLDLQLITNQIPAPTWLESARVFDHARKARTSYLAENMAGVDGRVHARFSPMVRTGRTSCSNPPLQQYPRDPLKDIHGNVLGETRSIWIPTPGYLFLATDYNQLELCALSQSCYHRFGRSVMGDIINSGTDVHLWFGCEVGRKQGMDFDPNDKKHPVTAELRQQAKAADFGIPGGLGKATFVAFARSYGVNLTLDEAGELIEFWLEKFPEMRQHLNHDEDEDWTRRNIKAWLRTNRMEARYVDTIQDLEDYLSGLGWEHDRIRKETSNLTVYMVRTLTGRLKRNCTYCSAANLEFQAPSADGAKLALWEGYIRGWRIVNFIHDEILQEISRDLSIDERMNKVREIENVMVTSMQSVLPDMTIKVESDLAERWMKKAEGVFDDNGNLLVWMPKEETASAEIARCVM